MQELRMMKKPGIFLEKLHSFDASHVNEAGHSRETGAKGIEGDTGVLGIGIGSWGVGLRSYGLGHLEFSFRAWGLISELLGNMFYVEERDIQSCLREVRKS